MGQKLCNGCENVNGLFRHEDNLSRTANKPLVQTPDNYNNALDSKNNNYPFKSNDNYDNYYNDQNNNNNNDDELKKIYLEDFNYSNLSFIKNHSFSSNSIKSTNKDEKVYNANDIFNDEIKQNNFDIIPNNKNNFGFKESNNSDDEDKDSDSEDKYPRYKKSSSIKKSIKSITNNKPDESKTIEPKSNLNNPIMVQEEVIDESSEFKRGKDNASDREEESFDLNLFPEKKYLYIGSKVGNKKEGFGLQKYVNEHAEYFGTFANDKRNGLCIYKMNNEECYTYKGEIENNKAKGFGIFINEKEKICYTGEWIDNNRNGIGIEVYNDNSIYKGEFANGKKCGIGEYHWADNSSYIGEWKDNALHGYGIYVFNDNTVYKGEWNDNKMEGLGEFTYPGDKTYFGYFQDEKKSGFGILLWLNEEKAYVGFWEDNLQNGFGKFIVKDKIRYGIWDSGKINEKTDQLEDIKDKMSDEELNYISYFKMNYSELKSTLKIILNL